MVDIVIGNVQPIISNVPQRQKSFSSGVEVKVLNIRTPREQRVPSAPDDRRRHHEQDPNGSRVLTILVPAGHPVPMDLDSGRYRVTLHVTKKDV